MTVITKPSVKAISLWTLLWLSWMALIFTFSHLPGSAWPPNTSWSYILERKGAHVVEYGVLLLLSTQVFSLFFYRSSLRQILALAITWSLAYGALDELHQSFVPYRGAHFYDVLVDALGVALGVLMIFIVVGLQRKKTPS